MLQSLNSLAQALHDQLSSIAEDNRVLSEKGDAHDLLQKEHAALQSQLEQLRSSASSIPLPTSPPPSDTDADGSLSLALSQSTERIRTLEASLHAATSRVHQLSRQLTDLQAAYATIQREKERDDLLLASSSPPSMGGIRTRGLGFSPTNEPTSPGLGLGRPPIISSRSVDMILPASVRQKRQVSLSALKARMDASKPLPSPSKMEAVVEGEGRSSPRRSDSSTHLAAQSQARKQFGDEIVFCCPACEGDLITL